METILITGINGFVGTILRKQLEGLRYPVHGIDVTGNDGAMHALDLTDQEAVLRCISQIRPTVIFHLAAISRVDFDNPATLYRTNVIGTQNILTAAIHVSPLPRVILVSSSQVYGIVDPAHQPITEEAPLLPVNHYGASKASTELIAGAFRMDYGLPVVVARPFNHIGRGQSTNFVVPKIVRAYQEKKAELSLGNITPVRDFSDVRDVVDAYIRIMEDFHDGEIYNIASGRGTSIVDIIRQMETLTGHRLTVHTSNDLLRKNEIAHAVGSSARIASRIGWEPRHTLADTLRWMLLDDE